MALAGHRLAAGADRPGRPAVASVENPVADRHRHPGAAAAGFAKEVADRVIYMCDGVIEEQGPPALVFSDPKSDRLKSFLKNVI